MIPETQIALLAELIAEDYSAVGEALSAAEVGLSAEAVSAVEAELSGIADSYDSIKEKHLRMAGGRDGIDLDFDRDRAALRSRARSLLKMTAASFMPTMMTKACGGRARY